MLLSENRERESFPKKSSTECLSSSEWSSVASSRWVMMNPTTTMDQQKTIHVGNLNSQVTAEVLREIFGCIGPIQDVRIAADGRYGFVDYVSADAATASLAMTGTMVCGSAIKVQRASQPKIYGNQAVPPPMPMLAQLHNDLPGALAGVTSPAVLAALAKGRSSEEPVVPNYAFMNPAQQRAAVEQRHREMLAQNKGAAWGVQKRHESDSDDEDRRRRRRSPSPRRDRRRSRYDDDDEPRDRRRRHRRDDRSRSRSRSRRRYYDGPHRDDDDDDDDKRR